MSVSKLEFVHVDEWLDSPTCKDDDGEKYAKFVLEHMRWPAWKQLNYAKWIREMELFCTWRAERYRCTGASSLGDVWLVSDSSKKHGYNHRVNVAECTGWSDKL